MKNKKYNVKMVLSDNSEIHHQDLSMELVFALLQIPTVNYIKVVHYIISECQTNEI